MSFVDDIIRRGITGECRQEESVNILDIQESQNIILYTYDTIYQMYHSCHPIGTLVYVTETQGVYKYLGSNKWALVGSTADTILAVTGSEYTSNGYYNKTDIGIL